MNRRLFLKNTSLISIGGLLLPSILTTNCRKEQLFEDVNYDGKVLIIGAGVAGLYAAYLLKSKGVDVLVLEASGTHGGRMGTVPGFADFPIDSGAQWLHGRNNILGDLIQQTNTNVTLDDSDLFYWFNNQLVTSLPKNTAIFEGEDLPDVSFKDYAIQQGLGTEYQCIVENLAGDQGASAAALSVYWNNKEEENWVSGDDDFKFKETFFDFIDKQIASKVTDIIHYNTPVTAINYAQDTILVSDVNGGMYQADKVIITVPITQLKANKIQFSPALPTEKTDAFSKIGMGAGIKVFLKFTTKFYDENIIGGSVCAAYADESVGKTGNDNILLAFIMGVQAENLTALGSDSAITTALLQELDVMYAGQATANFIASHVENWTMRPYIEGAYGYSTVGMGDARKIAAAQVNDKLFFAGEAMNINGHHQTVHGAVETGYREVINLLKTVKQ